MPNLPPLEPEQEELLTTVVEASRRVRREAREKFFFIETLGGSELQHPGLGEATLPAYRGDIEVLGRAGLLQVSERQRGVLTFDVTPLGFQAYTELKRKSGQAIERVQAEVRSYLDSHSFQEKYPSAYGKWREAESLLWQVETERQATTIGHLIREAMQEFASSLSHRYGIETEAGKADTVRRIRSVLKEKGARGKTREAFLEALLAYWGTVSDLVQRQEHGAHKEGEPLEWEDGRRIVFQAAVVMFEVERALS